MKSEEKVHERITRLIIHDLDQSRETSSRVDRVCNLARVGPIMRIPVEINGIRKCMSSTQPKAQSE